MTGCRPPAQEIGLRWHDQHYAPSRAVDVKSIDLVNGCAAQAYLRSSTADAITTTAPASLPPAHYHRWALAPGNPSTSPAATSAASDPRVTPGGCARVVAVAGDGGPGEGLWIPVDVWITLPQGPATSSLGAW